MKVPNTRLKHTKKDFISRCQNLRILQEARQILRILQEARKILRILQEARQISKFTFLNPEGIMCLVVFLEPYPMPGSRYMPLNFRRTLLSIP